MINIPPVTFAFIASFGGSVVNAMIGYLLNVVNMSVSQLIIMRLVSAFFPRRDYTEPVGSRL